MREPLECGGRVWVRGEFIRVDYFRAVEVVATELGFGGGAGGTKDFVEVGLGEDF